MLKIFQGNSLWHLVSQSDMLSKLVLLVLLVMSIFCWTIFFYKLMRIRAKKREVARALALLKEITTVDQLFIVANTAIGTIAGYVFSKNLAYLKMLLERAGVPHLSERNFGLLQESIAQTADDIIAEEESYVSFLSTSAVVSPLLGLFGTIWGLIHSFVRISELQTADIAAVAPGIAEALITTLAGLLVAIPALAMFNVIQMQLRGLEQRVFNLTDRLAVVLEALLVR